MIPVDAFRARDLVVNRAVQDRCAALSVGDDQFGRTSAVEIDGVIRTQSFDPLRRFFRSGPDAVRRLASVNQKKVQIASVL